MRRKSIKLNLLIISVLLLTWEAPNYCPLTFVQANTLKLLPSTPENLTSIIVAVESATPKDMAGIKVLAKRFGLEVATATKDTLLAKLYADLAELSEVADASETEAIGFGGGGSGGGEYYPADDGAADEKYAPGTGPERESKDDFADPASIARDVDLAAKPKTTGTENFYLSLVPGVRNWEPTVLPELRSVIEVDTVPFIGHYKDAQYHMRSPLAIIQGPPAILKRIWPASVRASLNDIADSKLEFAVVIWGPFRFVAEIMSPADLAKFQADPYNNVIFHAVVARWQERAWKATKNKWPKIVRGHYLWPNVRENILAGLFEPNGVRPDKVPIPFDKLGKVFLFIHPAPGTLDTKFSNNTEHFRLVDGREIASFWLVGKHAGHGIATLNLVIDSASTPLGNGLITAIRGANNLVELFTNLSEISATADERVNTADIATVANFNDQLGRIF